jgi:integrase/recombinase XerD
MKLCFSYAKVDLPDVSSHWLRRGFGMWALNNGVPIEIVSRALGHSSIAITERAYAKVLSKTVVEAITKIKR